MEIRNAQTTDKEAVLDFCKSTFSWGDYIQDVWDDWISEGNLFVLCENKLAVAVCHAFFMDNLKQVWIEGIRVNPNFRKKGYATKLVTYSEYVTKKRGYKASKMLIESNNFKSLNLAESLNYSKSELWNFYALSPKKTLIDNLIQTPSSSIIQEFLSNAKYYVRSWRWMPLDKPEISFLIDSKKIFISKNNDAIDSLVTVMTSDHFDNTLLVTLIYATSTGFEKIFKYLQNMAHENNHKKIQILTKIKNLPNYSDLEKRLSFYLMEKNLV